ncbi:zinc finger protein 618 [Podarcis raffonei]|uniref:zinc finger protein 618 n=1 Tax=Podarcis raffonei TaxID=65483 RepID=UPI002329075C|nr:zinc finger protein 618 [Podarcis raffonei]
MLSMGQPFFRFRKGRKNRRWRKTNRQRTAEGNGSSVGKRASASRDPPPSAAAMPGSDSPASDSAPPSEEAPPPAAPQVTVKTETPDDFAWPHGGPTEPRKGGRGAAPAEICVVLGGVRSQQTLGKLGSYECGICGKKYKYYNCFQTHVRAHRDTEVASGESASQGNNFRYTCDICGKKYKYYSCFQEHRDLHAVDDPYDQAMVAKDEVKEEDPEPFQKIGPKTGSYTCEFCGKQYKYYTPYQEHVALHAPIKYSRSPLLVAVKTHAGKKGPAPSASIIRCSALLHRAPSGASQLQMFRAPNSGSPGSKATTESVFSRRVESKLQNNYDETNSSSQNSSEPYTCGACGIQFQFYNNLLEHMQSHAADNENSLASPPPRSPPPAAPEEKWKPPAPQEAQNNGESRVPDKERQALAERLLRLACAEPALLPALSGPDFQKLAQALVDSGAQHGAHPVANTLGNLGALALQHLPRLYNQAKVKVTCALGAARGIGVTCHAHPGGHVLAAHRAEGGRLRSYVLAVRLEPGAGAEPVHLWAQNVLSEFVAPETRAAFVGDGAGFGKGGLSLRCAGCALNAAVAGVLSQRALQARGMPEVAELLATCVDLVGSANVHRAGSYSVTTPPCWHSPADALLAAHEWQERGNLGSRSAGAEERLNRALLGNLAALLAPVKQAVAELGAEGRPTLQLVLPTYARLEKLFTAKAGDAGVVSKLCHLFLEALKENFKLHPAHKAAMLLDPRQKLRPAPTYQHDEIVAHVCQLMADQPELEPGAAKKARVAGDVAPPGAEEAEVYAYLQEAPAAAPTDLLQYWAGAAAHPRLARLALWLLAVPAVGARVGCARLCEEAQGMRRRRVLGAEDANKLLFLRANML